MQATKHDIFADRREPAIRGQPIVDPADWTAQEIATSDEWCYELTAQEIRELRSAVAQFDREGVDVMPLTRSDFPLPTLGNKLRDLRVELLYGRSFGLIRGLPVDNFGKRATVARIKFTPLGKAMCPRNLSLKCKPGFGKRALKASFWLYRLSRVNVLPHRTTGRFGGSFCYE